MADSLFSISPTPGWSFSETPYTIINWGSFAQVFLKLTSSESLGKTCENFEDICSDDCTQVLVCDGPGTEPNAWLNCSKDEHYKYEFCKQVDDNRAYCWGDEPVCNGTSLKDIVVCDEFGIFPHPTQCEMSVFCSDDVQSKLTTICWCLEGYQMDITRPGLPCLPAAKCDRELVKCNAVGEQGNYPGSPDFCYHCGENGKISMYHCNLKEEVVSIPMDKDLKVCTSYHD